IPLVFRGRLDESAKTAVNKSVNARVSWSGVGLSLIRDFPKVSVTIERVAVVGVKLFEGDTLVTMRQAVLALDAFSVLGYLRSNGAIVVRELAFEQPVVRLRKLADGTTNWDITRPSPAGGAQTTSPLNITLRDLRISDADVALDDQQSHLVAS